MEDDELVTAWGLVVEAYAAVTRRTGAALAADGLEPTWFEVLLRLFRTPGHRLAMTQLATEVSFSSGGFTKLADRMCAAGVVARVACEEDRRVTWIELTDAGRSRIAAAMTDHAAVLRSTVLNSLGEPALRSFATNARTLRDALGPIEAHA